MGIQPDDKVDQPTESALKKKMQNFKVVDKEREEIVKRKKEVTHINLKWTG